LTSYTRAYIKLQCNSFYFIKFIVYMLPEVKRSKMSHQEQD